MKPKGLAFGPAGKTGPVPVLRACVRKAGSVRACALSSPESPEPQRGREAADSTPSMTWMYLPGRCSAAQSSCRGLGGASPTMQFFKSSLILLFASRVVLSHGRDLGLAQGQLQSWPSSPSSHPGTHLPRPPPSPGISSVQTLGNLADCSS